MLLYRYLKNFFISEFFLFVAIWLSTFGISVYLDAHRPTCRHMVTVDANKTAIVKHNLSYFGGVTKQTLRNLTRETVSDYKIQSTCRVEADVYTSHDQTCRIWSERLRKNILVGLDHIKKSTSNVFFLETRCGTNSYTREFRGSHDFVLSARQCCTVESTARANPTRDVYVFHSCPLRKNFIASAGKFARKLLELPNVRVVIFNWSLVFQGSPVQELFESGKIERSRWRAAHYSDVLRLVVLWKFGGTYSDLDSINIRPLDQLKTNYCGQQDGGLMANGLLNIEPYGFTHDVILYELLKRLNKQYSNKQRGLNGPKLLTKIVHQECGSVIYLPNKLKHSSKYGLFISYHPSVFYPIPYNKWRDFFDASKGRATVENVKKTAFSVHFWNYYSAKTKVLVGSTQAYALLAEEFCPETYTNSGHKF